jgi:hypothetical protein
MFRPQGGESVFDVYLDAYSTVILNDEKGRSIEFLTPRISFDPAICGACALTGRIIYSQREVIEIIHLEIIASHLRGARLVVPLELARESLKEAELRYKILILGPSETSTMGPVFLDDDSA